ncbi:MAG: TIR domain-containing protein [Rhizomicrobium sp.]
MMTDVFISYSRKDKPKVVVIADGLRSLGIAVWMDDQLRSGELSYDKATADQLQAATAVLACWSPQSIDSEWARSEAAFARENRKLIACFIEPCVLFPPFNLVQTEDLSDWKGEVEHPRWLALIGALAAKLRRPQIESLLRARITKDEAALLAYAQAYPDELEAAKIWRGYEDRHRADFDADLREATVAAAAASDEFRDRLQDAIAETRQRFETWLAACKNGPAQQPRPSPTAAVNATNNDSVGLSAAQARVSVLTAENTRMRTERKATGARLDVAVREIEVLNGRLRDGAERQDVPTEARRPLLAIAALLAGVAVLGWLVGVASAEREKSEPPIQIDAATANQIAALRQQLTHARGAGSDVSSMMEDILKQTSTVSKELDWPKTAVTGLNYADEATDWNVPVTNTLANLGGGETPMTSPVAERITTADLVGKERDSLLLDVWAGDEPHKTVPGAVHVSGAGGGGTFSDALQGKFVALLGVLTNENKGQRIVIFCLGARCWESYDALLRAAAAGYKNLAWYRGGLEAWDAAKLTRQSPIGVYTLD